jgi:hypothetical protein
MTRGNQRDLAREKNLKKEQVNVNILIIFPTSIGEMSMSSIKIALMSLNNNVPEAKIQSECTRYVC